MKNQPRGLEGTFRTAAEMERHRAQLADAAIEEQLEVQTAFREHGARLQVTPLPSFGWSAEQFIHTFISCNASARHACMWGQVIVLFCKHRLKAHMALCVGEALSLHSPDKAS